MGCNCGGSKRSGNIIRYDVVTPDGQKRSFLTQTEAKIAIAASGGTITPITNTVK